MRKIRVESITLDVDRDHIPDNVILRAASNKEIADVLIPTLEVPTIASGLVIMAQKAARRLPPAEVESNIAGQRKHLVPFFPAARNVFITTDGSTLVVDVGCGAINFKLTPEAIAALRVLQIPED